MSKAHFLLVHGAYHSSWHWHRVVSALAERGHTSTAIDLPSSGADCSLTTDCNHILRNLLTLCETYESIIPVFHSYSAYPASDALHDLPPGLRRQIPRVIFLASCLPSAGESLLQPTSNVSSPSAFSASRTGGNMRYITDATPFYHDIAPDLAKSAVERLRDQSWTSLTTAPSTEGWREYTGTYIRCMEDQALPLKGLWGKGGKYEVMLKAQQGWGVREIDGGHSPFLSKPVKLVDLLLEIIGEDSDVAM